VDQIDEVAVPVRYAVLMTPLQVGLLGLLMRYAARGCGLLLTAGNPLPEPPIDV
jgi:hypothetical protein